MTIFEIILISPFEELIGINKLNSFCEFGHQSDDCNSV
jgi:hypothetical protein